MCNSVYKPLTLKVKELALAFTGHTLLASPYMAVNQQLGKSSHIFPPPLYRCAPRGPHGPAAVLAGDGMLWQV